MTGSQGSVVVVLGVWRSGTSCVAGMLSRLGFSFGEPFHPPANANPRGFYEERHLHAICTSSFAEPLLQEQRSRRAILSDLTSWLRSRRVEAASGQGIGAKHPSLCAIAPMLPSVWGPLRIVAVDRKLSAIHRSHQRFRWWPSVPPEVITQQVLEQRDRGLARLEHLRISYDAVVAEPLREAKRLADFVGVSSAERVQAAAEFVDPALNRSDIPLPRQTYQSPIAAGNRTPKAPAGPSG